MAVDLTGHLTRALNAAVDEVERLRIENARLRIELASERRDRDRERRETDAALEWSAS